MTDGSEELRPASEQISPVMTTGLEPQHQQQHQQHQPHLQHQQHQQHELHQQHQQLQQLQQAHEPHTIDESEQPRVKKYKAYTAEDVVDAMNAVQGGMSLRKASRTFRVPKTTLAEKLGGSCPTLPPLLSQVIDGNIATSPRGADSGSDGPAKVNGKPASRNRIATRFTWTETDMTQAVTAVKTGHTSVSDAARQFGVPASNLNSLSRGRQPKDLKGEMSRLTLSQETLLADWARVQAELGFPPTRDDIYELANKVARGTSTSAKNLGKQWVGHWLRRNPRIQALGWISDARPNASMIRTTSLSSRNIAESSESMNAINPTRGSIGDPTPNHSNHSPTSTTIGDPAAEQASNFQNHPFPHEDISNGQAQIGDPSIDPSLMQVALAATSAQTPSRMPSNSRS